MPNQSFDIRPGENAGPSLLATRPREAVSTEEYLFEFLKGRVLSSLDTRHNPSHNGSNKQLRKRNSKESPIRGQAVVSSTPVPQILHTLNAVLRTSYRRWWLFCALLSPALLLAGCGAVSPVSPTSSRVTLVVSPTSAVVDAGSAQQFTATVKGSTNTVVTWLVNNIPGGNSTVGTISSTGLFTTPASSTANPTETITAVSAADPSKPTSVPVRIIPTTGVSISVSPAAATVQAGLTQQCTATVTGTHDTAVTWLVNNIPGGSSRLGTISSNGLFTAPATPPANASETITAVSSADSTKSASAAVTVTPAQSAISVSVAPTSVTVQVGLTAQFTATVTGTNNTAVMWSVNDIQGGNSGVGTISATGLFIAPATVPGNPSVNVTATSYQDQTKSATATVVIASLPSGSDYYVEPGGSDSNDGSSAHPWRTIQHAANVVTAGATVHVAPGTYTENLTTSASGAAGNPITYVSDGRWGAEIVGSSGDQVWINYGDYVTINGFEITATNSAARLGLNTYGTHGRVINNKIHDLQAVGSGSSGGAGVNTDNNQSGLSADYTEVSGNLIYNIGVSLKPSTHVHGIYIGGSNHNLIANNIAANVAGWGIQQYHTGVGYSTIVNNTVVNSGGGILIGSGDAAAPSDYNYVANNIAVYSTANYGLRECCSSGSVGTHNTYTNNLFYQNSPANTYFVAGTAVHSVIADPLFVNYKGDGSGDYDLQAGSPAIDAGTSQEAPALDFQGGARPVGSAFDIGAYEWGSSPGVWPWE